MGIVKPNTTIGTTARIQINSTHWNNSNTEYATEANEIMATGRHVRSTLLTRHIIIIIIILFKSEYR